MLRLQELRLPLYLGTLPPDMENVKWSAIAMGKQKALEQESSIGDLTGSV